VKEAPGSHYEANADQTENHSDEVRVIPTGYDVVHVSDKSSDGDQAHMHRQKAQVTN
jgi:hypothetical protein